MLLSEENPRGTFLIRNSEQNPGSFSLSVKDWEQDKSYHIKHYKIRPLEDGSYYITTRIVFQSLRELVQSYSSMSSFFNFSISLNPLSVFCFCDLIQFSFVFFF